MSENKFCSSCGAKLDATVQFCQNCGTAVEVDAEVAKEPTEETVVEQVGTDQAPAPVPVLIPPTKEEKNKLIALMIVSIIIPPVGIVLGIIRYSKQDKKAGQHYLLCGLSAIAFALGAWNWVGYLAGALLVASAVYTGLQSINKGAISLEI